jgi:hypothetical protein
LGSVLGLSEGSQGLRRLDPSVAEPTAGSTIVVDVA